MWVPGTITAADIPMSLADMGLLSYQFSWHERIGAVDVLNYYLERVDDWQASGACGFVYEVGEETTARGNHIHVQTDICALGSPECALFCWIELGPC